MANYSLGIDIGGTFTDIVVYNQHDQTVSTKKVLTSNDDPSRAVLEGLSALLESSEIKGAELGRVVHATTLFTNALIERRGARCGLITTEGFRDILEIGRERKYDLYDIASHKPEPLIARDLRAEVCERIGPDGEVITPLDEAELVDVVSRLVVEGVTSIAVIFLHSYVNRSHERRAAEVISARFPDLAVSTSAEVAPEIREYERASTTAANAYIKPLARHYLHSMERQIAALGTTAPLFLMLSSGGLTNVSEAKRTPVQMLESGPAAGAIAAAHMGRDDSGGNLLAFDMGGTTAKLSLIDGVEPLVAYSFEAAREKRFTEGSGLPIRISTIELIEVGAGGGSIAYLDEVGLMKVGPRSAGSNPGPAAYGLGGSEATVTDADFLLGYLCPEGFANGAVDVSMSACRSALDAVADDARLSLTEVAWGIHEIVNENMANAARVHIAERGRDPRDYALLATGGAGPVHACQVARKLGIRRLICPPSAGVASALGLLVAPARVDRVATVGVRLDRADWNALEQTFQSLEREARAVVSETGLDPEAGVTERLADGRFVGQGFELVVVIPDGPYENRQRGECERRMREVFEQAYREKFGHTPPDNPIEFTNVRVSVRSPVSERGFGFSATNRGRSVEEAQKGTRSAYFPELGGFIEVAVYDRQVLDVGHTFSGPAIVEDEGSTLIVGHACEAQVAESGNLVVTLED